MSAVDFALPRLRHQQAGDLVGLVFEAGLDVVRWASGTGNGQRSTGALWESSTSTWWAEPQRAPTLVIGPVIVSAASPSVAVESVEPQTTASMLEHVRDMSGLTWDQISKIFGVSRRSIHLWAAGARMSAANEARLVRLEADIAALPGTTPDERRHLLLGSQIGRSVFDDYRHSRASSGQDINRYIEPEPVNVV